MHKGKIHTRVKIIGQVAPIAIFHYQVDILVSFFAIQQTNNIFMM